MSVDDGLRALFRKHLPTVDWQSIENGISRGVPDSNYCHRGVEGWIECKSTRGWDVTLRPEQIGWIARRARAGGRVHVAIRRRHDGGPRRGPAVDELWLLPGSVVKAARLGGLRDPVVRAAMAGGPWQGGPARWHWEAVLGCLLAPLALP